MTTAASVSQRPNTLAPLGLAIASTIAFAWLMSEGGNGLAGGIKFVAVLASIVFSTRYSIRTFRRLAGLEFEFSDALRWLPLLLALAANLVTCLMVAGISVIALGVMLTGKGMVGQVRSATYQAREQAGNGVRTPCRKFQARAGFPCTLIRLLAPP